MATLRIVVVLVIVAVVAAAFITVIVATVVVASAASRCHNMATFSLRMNRCISFHFVLCVFVAALLDYLRPSALCLVLQGIYALTDCSFEAEPFAQ